MSGLRWYLDEDTMAHGLVVGLRARGSDVLTVFEAGMVGETDARQLELASRLGRVLYSFNVRDFCRLHQDWVESGRSHAGIVVVSRQQHRIGEQVRGLLTLGSRFAPDQMRGRLEFLRVP